MIGGWLRARRRRKLLAAPFPAEWLQLLDGLEFYSGLDAERQGRLRVTLRVFAAEKRWEGCRGLEVTDEMRVVIGAQAGRMILELDHEYFRRLRTILIYPSAYWNPGLRSGPGGTVEGGSHNAGESWSGGPVVLAWDSVLRGARDPDDGHNLVYHEFAHVLDCLDGWADGVPPAGSRDQYGAWKQILDREYEELRERAASNRATLLDAYGATNPAEFFAVATECFFERPRALKRKHAALYDLLATFYRQDPEGAA